MVQTKGRHGTVFMPSVIGRVFPKRYMFAPFAESDLRHAIFTAKGKIIFVIKIAEHLTAVGE